MPIKFPQHLPPWSSYKQCAGEVSGGGDWSVGLNDSVAMASHNPGVGKMPLKTMDRTSPISN